MHALKGCSSAVVNQVLHASYQEHKSADAFFFGTGGEVQMALLQLFLVNQDEHMLDEQGAEKTCAS